MVIVSFGLYFSVFRMQQTDEIAILHAFVGGAFCCRFSLLSVLRLISVILLFSLHFYSIWILNFFYTIHFHFGFYLRQITTSNRTVYYRLHLVIVTTTVM